MSDHQDLIIAESTGDEQIKRANGRFVAGQSGNPKGRPKGSKNVLSKSVLGTYAKEAANGQQGNSGLCEACGGEVEKVILNVSFRDIPADHPVHTLPAIED
jgi:hypothetical protein